MTAQNILAVASRHADWIAARRTVVAGNIANANTPGFKARDVEPFALESSASPAGLEVSHAAHFPTGSSSSWLASPTFETSPEEHHSGNAVSLDREMMKAGALAREQSLNAGLMKAFYRLLNMSARG